MGPRGTGPRGTCPRSTGPRGTGPRGTGPRGTGPRGTGPRGTGPRGTGPRGTGPRGTTRHRPTRHWPTRKWRWSGPEATFSRGGAGVVPVCAVPQHVYRGLSLPSAACVKMRTAQARDSCTACTACRWTNPHTLGPEHRKANQMLLLALCKPLQFISRCAQSAVLVPGGACPGRCLSRAVLVPGGACLPSPGAGIRVPSELLYDYVTSNYAIDRRSLRIAGGCGRPLGSAGDTLLHQLAKQSAAWEKAWEHAIPSFVLQMHGPDRA
eukprot:gene5584-biopygen8769